MTYEFTPRWDRPHRVRWTDEGWLCDAGEDCPICEEQYEEEEEEEDDE